MAVDDELSLRSDEALFLSQAMRVLLADGSPVDALQLLGRIVGAKTVAVFAPQDCLWVWGEQSEEALRVGITELEEPCVVECRRTGGSSRRPAGDESPVFGETDGLALPLPGRDEQCLYLGRVRPLEEVRARLFARHLADFLSLHEQKRKSSREAREFRELSSRLRQSQEGTRRALAALTKMETSLDTVELLEAFSIEVGQSLEYSSGFLVIDGETYPLGATALNQAHSKELLTLVAATRVSVVLESFEESPYQSLSQLGQFGLVSPLPTGGGLVLIGDTPFDQHHRAAAELSVGYLALSLRFSKLHKNIQRSQAEMARAGRLASVGQMAAGLAHEINNPLGSIALALDTVKRFVESKPAVALSVLDDAFSAIERAQEIVRKMLHFSRDSRQGYRRMKTSDWLQDLNTILAPRLTQESAEVSMSGPEDELELYANPGELTQVAVNLVFNSLDAMKELNRAPVLLRVQEDRGDWVLTVADQGCGVPGQNAERIFEPFFTTKDVGDGTGLGLHISRQIVSAHEGTLSLLDSQRGALFEVRIPLRREKEPR